jgi:hypothetical protein
MAKYFCDTCNKPQRIDPTTLQVGDEVNFTVSTIGRSKASFKSRAGTITAIYGDKCSIETGRGKNKTIIVRSLSELTPSDAPSPLTYAFGECKCGQGEANGS